MSENSEFQDHKKFNANHVQIARKLIAENINHELVKKSVKIHDEYYLDVKNDLENLVKLVAKSLAKRDAKQAREIAVQRMKNDAALMQEVQKYVLSLDGFNHNNAFVRFAFNKTPIILSDAVDELQRDEYFAFILRGEIPYNFAWNELTMIGGVENSDEKGGSAISSLAASLFYLLEGEDLQNAVRSSSSILYNESIKNVLKDNSELLQKIRQNYYLFTPENDVVSKVYEAYEFGGDVNLDRIYNAKYLPLDCSSGIAGMVNIKENKFSTYHLASYYNEFFKENSVYWTAYDWQIRDEIIKNLQPIKFENYDKVQAGDILAWRNLDNEKSLKEPSGYVGRAGHIGVVIGKNDGKIYYFSWLRNLDEADKSGFGVDVVNVESSSKRIAEGKLMVFVFRGK